MSIGVQILIGAVLGLVFGFFTIIGAINSKEKALLAAWQNLLQALNLRYVRLKSLLGILKNTMTGFRDEIDSLLNLCDEGIDVSPSIENLISKLEIENKINYTLEEIKSNMANFPALQDNPEVDGVILSIAESEVHVGEAINKYNSVNLEYRVFLETFPINIFAWILNKNTEIPPFTVTSVEEFDDNYIDEDSI